MRWLFCLMVLIPVMAAGCAMVGPDYKKVTHKSPENWEARMEKGLAATRPESDTLSQWWDVLGDPVLSELEQKAVEGNLEIQTALSRLRQARIRRGISRSDLYPGMDGSGQVQRQRGSEAMPTSSAGEETDYYKAGFDASWELDLFGGIRRSVQAAQAEVEASRADLQDVLTSLMAEVAVTYIEIRTYQQRVDVTRPISKSRKKPMN